jgi:O-antigen/teichoic acid export membrane protein
VTVITAWYGWGYWALFAGNNTGKIVAMIVLCCWKHVPFSWPRWSDIRKPVEMGRHIAVGRVASTAYSFADTAVITRTMGEAAVGIYYQAMNVAAAPAEKISALIMRAATPLFANVMDDLAQARRYYLIIVEVLSLSIMPLMTGLVIVAPQAISLTIGDKWLAATRPLQWLGAFMIMRVLGTLAEQVLVSQRLTRFTMRMSILNFVVMPLAFIVAVRWNGPSGVAAAWILLSPVTIVPLLVILLIKIKLPFRDFAMALVPAVTGATVMCLAVLGMNRILPLSLPMAVRLAAEIVVGGVVYGGFILGFFRARVQRYVNFISSLRSPKQTAEPSISEPSAS